MIKYAYNLFRLYYTHNIVFCQYIFLLDLVSSPLSRRFFFRTPPTLPLTPPLTPRHYVNLVLSRTPPALPPTPPSHHPSTAPRLPVFHPLPPPSPLQRAPHSHQLAPSPHALSATLPPVELCFSHPPALCSHSHTPHPTPPFALTSPLLPPLSLLRRPNTSLAPQHLSRAPPPLSRPTASHRPSLSFFHTPALLCLHTLPNRPRNTDEGSAGQTTSFNTQKKKDSAK